jgi:hypothetical protein
VLYVHFFIEFLQILFELGASFRDLAHNALLDGAYQFFGSFRRAPIAHMQWWCWGTLCAIRGIRCVFRDARAAKLCAQVLSG